MGQLVPIMCMECVPSDRITLEAESLVRFAPLVSPTMHRFDVSIHYFFVPHRILWENWEDYVRGEGTPEFPTIRYGSAVGAVGYNKLLDYMGLPSPGSALGVEAEVSALPFAAYQMIFNEYYRDQNLMPEVNFSLNNGDNTGNADLTTLRNRCWEHDYFTAALPWAQKGAAVDLPLGSVELDPRFGQGNPDNSRPHFIDETDFDATGTVEQLGLPGATQIELNSGGSRQAYDPDGTLIVGSTTISDLRRAYRLQEFLELGARAGTRYNEMIRAFFGIIPQDARLQRPEYVTGTKSPVVISEILNTAGESLPQGNMAGHGVSVTSGRAGRYFVQEHGYMIGIMSIMPKTAYQQGIPKHFLKFNDRFELYWPQFAHIGEQPVLNQEVYAFGAAPNGTFGYVPRYAEYKFEQNRVAGQFRNNLDFWHAGRIFDTQPALNAQFVTANPTKRIFAVTDPDVDSMYIHVYNKVGAIRPMPKYGTPMM